MARGEQPQLVLHRSGARVLVNPREHIGRAVVVAGDYDALITDTCMRVLREGDTVVDIGAHCGLVTFTSAKVVGPTGIVHAFEPQPILAQMIRDTQQQTGVRNVKLHELALSTSDGEAVLHLPGGSECEASLESAAAVSRGGRSHKDVVVKVLRGDAYLSTLDIKAVRLLKIDVEGHEAAVFQGASEFFGRTPPDVVLMESHPSRGSFWQRGEVAFLKQRGYRFVGLARRPWQKRYRAVDEAALLANECHDFVAIAPTAGGDEALSRLMH